MHNPDGQHNHVRYWFQLMDICELVGADCVDRFTGELRIKMIGIISLHLNNNVDTPICWGRGSNIEGQKCKQFLSVRLSLSIIQIRIWYFFLSLSLIDPTPVLSLLQFIFDQASLFLLSSIGQTNAQRDNLQLANGYLSIYQMKPTTNNSWHFFNLLTFVLFARSTNNKTHEQQQQMRDRCPLYTKIERFKCHLKLESNCTSAQIGHRRPPLTTDFLQFNNGPLANEHLCWRKLFAQFAHTDLLISSLPLPWK